MLLKRMDRTSLSAECWEQLPKETKQWISKFHGHTVPGELFLKTSRRASNTFKNVYVPKRTSAESLFVSAGLVCSQEQGGEFTEQTTDTTPPPIRRAAALLGQTQRLLWGLVVGHLAKNTLKQKVVPLRMVLNF